MLLAIYTTYYGEQLTHEMLQGVSDPAPCDIHELLWQTADT